MIKLVFLLIFPTIIWAISPSDSGLRIATLGEPKGASAYVPRCIVEEKNPHNIEFILIECQGCDYCKSARENSSNMSQRYYYHPRISPYVNPQEYDLYDRFNELAFPPYMFAIQAKCRPLQEPSYNNVTIVLSGAGIGEAFDYYLVSKDKSTHICASAIPHPIEAKGKDKAVLSAVMLDLDRAHHFVVQGKNFRPFEKVKLVSTSCGDVISRDQCMSPSGEFIMLADLAVVGREGGVATLAIVRSNETLSIDIPWGTKQLTKRKINEPFVHFPQTEVNVR